MKVKDEKGNAKEVDIFFKKEIANGCGVRKVLTPEAIKLVEGLGSVLCTEEEIAVMFGCSRETLHNDWNGEAFKQAFEKGKANGKAGLRRKQFEMAMKGNVSMLIWLGKQCLGQRDKIAQDISFRDDENLRQMKEYMDGLKRGTGNEE